MLIIPKILEYSQEPPGDTVYGVGLCLALFLTECLKSLTLCSSWVVNQRTGIRLRSAVFLFAFQKLIQFKSLTHVTTGEVSDSARLPAPAGCADAGAKRGVPPPPRAPTGSPRTQSSPVLPLLHEPGISCTKPDGAWGDARQVAHRRISRELLSLILF